jgi:hypothetical protein
MIGCQFRGAWFKLAAAAAAAGCLPLQVGDYPPIGCHDYAFCTIQWASTLNSQQLQNSKQFTIWRSTLPAGMIMLMKSYGICYDKAHASFREASCIRVRCNVDTAKHGALPVPFQHSLLQ